MNENDDLLLFEDEQEEEELKKPEEKKSEEDLFLDDPNKDDTKQLEGGETQNQGQGNQTPRGRLIGDQTPRIGGTKVDVDIVFVIDCTGSMEPFLSMVKDKAKTLHKDIMEGLKQKSRLVNTLRIRVVAFRDYYFDWVDPENPPMTESEFYTLPEDQEEYEAFVDKLDFAGGLDEPESALEALHLAFNSKWLVNPEITKRRQIIMLFTDASAHPLDDPMRSDPEKNSHYPQEMPATLDELQNEYYGATFPLDDTQFPSGHRLILFAPEGMYPWNEMKNWDETQLKNMDPQSGLENVSMDDIIQFISGSL